VLSVQDSSLAAATRVLKHVSNHYYFRRASNCTLFLGVTCVSLLADSALSSHFNLTSSSFRLFKPRRVTNSVLLESAVLVVRESSKRAHLFSL